MIKLGLCISGELGQIVLKQLFDQKAYGIGFVLTDKKSESIISFCNNNSIFLYIGNPRDGKAYNLIKEIKIDILVSVNYLYLLDEDVIKHPDNFAFNIHGSLLPKYRGRTPHVWAIINGEKEVGITAHLIDKGCDTGDILIQKKVRVENNDTGGSILEKYKKMYLLLLNEVLQNFKNKTLNPIPQNHLEATYFEKRTPDDGMIDWNWSGEQIKNWVRAQAYPYPGAFSFLNKEKIIIDEVDYVEKVILDNQKPGTIISKHPQIIVTCKDGEVIIKKIRTGNDFFDVGKIVEK